MERSIVSNSKQPKAANQINAQNHCSLSSQLSRGSSVHHLAMLDMRKVEL